ncbi:MAG: sulfotransferase domain-containing protein [Actinomycetota bacterium]|nr:sulfotransferase domain-containing protein [Actinomycetota bacterium]
MAGLRSFARGTWRSFKGLVKGNTHLRQGYLRLKGGFHRARLRGAGLGTNPAGGGARSGRVDPAKIVWIFCTSRSGSTWLRSMMEDLAPGETWEEPKVAKLFGGFLESALEEQLDSTNFVMGNPTRESWISSIRNFVLDAASACNPSLKAGQFLLVKEPDGGAGAPLMMEALPESRMVLLVRDPRDVASSALDATKEGAWMNETPSRAPGRRTLSERKPDVFVNRRSKSYLRQITNAKRAYDAHEGLKALVRYEDLRSDTLGTMRRLCAELAIPVGEERLARVVEKHSWENVPKAEKGEGKFYRKATPGGWQEELTPEQVRIVEEITAPLLREFYP